MGGKCPGEAGAAQEGTVIVEELSGGNCTGGNLPRVIFDAAHKFDFNLISLGSFYLRGVETF